MLHRVGGLLNWIGGGIGRAAATGLAVAGVFLVFGMTPPELLIYLATAPPPWLLSGWMRLAVLIVGLAIIYLTLRVNIWSRKQIAIDDLAEDISWVIANILNKQPRPNTDDGAREFEGEFQTWCSKVSKKLENRAFFTRADQLHFDRLGFVPAIGMAAHPKVNHILEMLSLKLDRLRDIINWSQERLR